LVTVKEQEGMGSPKETLLALLTIPLIGERVGNFRALLKEE
jgi:hypothetical protein